MKKSALFISALLFYFASHSQKVFFKSSQSISTKHLEVFYASVAIGNDLFLFNAPDYELYAYDKNTGEEKWRYHLDRKSNEAPFFAGGFIWAASGHNGVVKLDPKTGKCLKTLDGFSMETQPFVKNDILYFTGIYDGGCVFAYDMNADSVIWKRFLAHGCSKTPYYLDDKIVANAEGDNWIEINYDGTLKERGCDSVEVGYPSELPCAKQFAALTHDGKQINHKLAKSLSLSEYGDAQIVTSAKYSFILSDGNLSVLGNKLKKKFSMPLASLSDSLENDSDIPSKILKVDEENIFLLYSNAFIVYNYRKKKLVKMIDLRQWSPHQATLDGNRLWLVNRQDGLSYGLSTE